MKDHEFTPEFIIEFTGAVFQVMSEKYGGACTINELITMNKALSLFMSGQECTPTVLHELTNITKPTITRTIQRLVKKGYLLTKPHPSDGRQRSVEIGPAMAARIPKDIHYFLGKLNSYVETREMKPPDSNS